MSAKPTFRLADLVPSPAALLRAMRLRCFPVLFGLGVAAQDPMQAGTYTIPDITHAVSTTEHFNFDSAWAGSPAINNMSGETSVYLKFTASWPASAAPGDFDIRFNVDDNGGRGRAQVDFNDGVLEIYTESADSDGDGAGPATARPVFSVNPATMTSATFVLKVNQTLAGSGDWHYGTVGQQDAANGFIYVNPNLVAAEASSPTVISGWRSGQNGYQSVTFETRNLASGGMTFTNIALYTGDDTPFSAISAVADAGTSTVSASPSAVPANGSTESTVTVTLRDAGNNPVSSKEVSLDGNGSAVIATSNAISNVNGVVTFTVKSGTPGLETFTATDVTDGNLAITQTAGVNFQEVIPVGPVDAGNSTVTASPATVSANGIAISTITVTLKDANGLLVIGEDVALGGNPSVASISPPGAQATDANGRAVFSVSSTTVGTVTISATSVTDGITITDTAEVEFVDPATTTAYNVNFLDEGQAALAGQVGVVGNPGETWNQGTTSVSSLADSTDTVTSAVSVSGLGNDGRSISNPGLKVFGGVRNLLAKGSDVTISITGLEANTAYDLYIYSLSHNPVSWGKSTDTERAAGDFTTVNTVLGNGQSQWLDNAVPGTNASAFAPNGNYVSFQSIVSDGSGNISVVADAYDGIDGLPATNDGNTRLHVNALQIRPASGMSVDYMKWRDTSHPGLGLPGEDDDGDGFSNDYERIFGMDPTASASANPFVIPFDPDTGTFSYSRRNPLLANLDYKLWYSTDLEDWFRDNGAFQSLRSVTNGVETIDVGIDPELLSEPKLFVQMRASAVSGIDLEPQLLSIRGGGNMMTLLFSEPMHPSTAANPANYEIRLNGGGMIGITGASVSADGASVTLNLAAALGTDTAYTVTLDGLTSGTGQSMESGLSRAFKTFDDSPAGVKVFIVAGQSNMVGRGESERGFGDVAGAIGSLRYQVVNDNANYGQLVTNSGNPAADPWVVRSDVKLYWNRADVGGGPAVSQGGLAPVFGSGATTFGPEYGMGWALGEHFSEPVLIIKTAWGGKDLFNNFRSPGAVAKRGGSVGSYYIEMIEQVREVLENFDTLYPEWSAQGYQIAGFGWHQGWNDSLDTFASNEYEANMANFITDIRAEFNRPSLPVAIGTTGMVGAATSGDRLTVVNAQINVANPTLHPELGGNVFTVDTRPFARTDAQSPTNDTTHWKNNGESMWLIGKGMGEGMVDLLSP